MKSACAVFFQFKSSELKYFYSTEKQQDAIV